MTETSPFEIVIAEDNPADVMLVGEALRHHKVERAIRAVSGGKKRRTLIGGLDSGPRAPKVDLLILEMHLPEHDGAEILEQLRSMEHYAQTPVILLTCLDSSQVEAKAAQNAPLSYCRKASTLDGFTELGAVVRKILSAHDSSSRHGAADQRHTGVKDEA